MKKVLWMALIGCALLGGAERFPERGFYLAANVMVEAQLPKIEALAERAARAGYNTVYFADWKFGQPWKFGEKYTENLRRVISVFRKNNIAFVASILPLCDPCSFNNEVPQEVEAAPVKGEPYRIVNGRFTAENRIANSSFEHGFDGWRPDFSAPRMRIDEKIAATGKNSVHFSARGAEDTLNGMMRLWINVECQPFRHYALSFKLKTANLVSTGKYPQFGFNVCPLGLDDSQPDGFRYLSYRQLFNNDKVASTQDWREYRIVFNSLEHKNIKLALGMWGIKSGEFWIDDVQLKPAGFLNVVRRADTPVKVTSADGKLTYREGVDFSRIVDPKMGNVRWKGDFGDKHQPPEISVLPGSRIKEGDVVLADYHHAMFGLNGAMICLHSSRLRPLIDRQVDWFEKNIQPDGYLLNVDEYRVYGYDPACVKAGIPCGKALNELVRHTYDRIRAAGSKRKVYMWNDMFDPYANAYQDRFYYLVRGKGSIYGSWEGLPKDIVILHWTCTTLEKLRNATGHFKKQGMRYIVLPGYFDSKTFNSKAEERLKELASDPACIGAGFAQWSGLDHFHHLEAFAELVRKFR